MTNEHTVALTRPEDVAKALARVERLLRKDARAAERAMARYAVPSQALIVRRALIEGLERSGKETRVDALNRAGQRAERLLDTIGDATAHRVVEHLDSATLGTLLGARAGEAYSTVAHHLPVERISALLAEDLELWLGESAGGDEGPHLQRLNVTHLVRVLWTILQVEDALALRFIGGLNPDLVALPLAVELEHPAIRGQRALRDAAAIDAEIAARHAEARALRASGRIEDAAHITRVILPTLVAKVRALDAAHVDAGDADDGSDAGDAEDERAAEHVEADAGEGGETYEDDEGAAPAFFRTLRTLADRGPSEVDGLSSELRELLARIYTLSPEKFGEIVARAGGLDVEVIAQALIEESLEEAGLAQPTTSERTRALDDDMFAPLPPAKSAG